MWKATNGMTGNNVITGRLRVRSTPWTRFHQGVESSSLSQHAPHRTVPGTSLPCGGGKNDLLRQRCEVYDLLRLLSHVGEEMEGGDIDEELEDYSSGNNHQEATRDVPSTSTWPLTSFR